MDTSGKTAGPVASKNKRRWWRWLVGIIAGLVILLVAAYWIATSSAFVNGVVLPRVGRALNSKIQATDISIHPLGRVSLRNLTVQPNGQKPLLTASAVRVRYHLFDILRGNIRVDDVVLDSPRLEVIVNPDGSASWDPLLSAMRKSASKAPAPARPAGVSKPPQVDLGSLTLTNASILEVKHLAGGGSDVMAVTNVNITLANLKNGQTANLHVAAQLGLEQVRPAGTNSSLAAGLDGNFHCSFTPDLKPGAADGNAEVSVSRATGLLENFDRLATTLTCQVTPTEIKDLALNFQKAGAPLGTLAVAGPFDANRMEGKLKVDLRGVDRRLLNLVGATGGLDFGTTTLNASNEIDLAKSGRELTVTGSLKAGRVQVKRAGQTTPTLDLGADYSINLDRDTQLATIRRLDLHGTQDGAPLLSGSLAAPMNLAWGGSGGQMGHAAFTLAVTRLNLADWKPFLGDAVSTGEASLKLNVSSDQGGKELAFGLDSDLANFSGRLGTNSVSGADVHLVARGLAAQFNQVTLSNFNASVALQNQRVLTASGAGVCRLKPRAADLTLRMHAAPAQLLQAWPQPGLRLQSGDLDLAAHVIQEGTTQSVTGTLVLTNINGDVGPNHFRAYGGTINLDLANSPGQIQIKNAAAVFNQDGKPGGGLDASGTWNPATGSADLAVKLSKLNENALRPFLEPLLAGNHLASVTLSGDLSAQKGLQDRSALKADVQISNLVVANPKHPAAPTPLSAGLRVDGALQGKTADLRQFQLTLTPTARAANQLQVSGHLDLAQTNSIQGNLSLAADSLDLTRYYDLFSGSTNAASKAAPPAAPTPSTPAPAANQEPAAIHLPLQNFTLAARIGRLYLHEIAISNLQTTATIQHDQIHIKPLQLTLNGGPADATADLDVGVPGYKYQVAFNAQKIPLAPLVDTFEPERAGQLGGQLTAAMRFNGAGITGAGLQKNLAGNFDLNITNLNLSVVNVKSPWLKTIINVVATVPQLLQNWDSGIASLLSAAASGTIGHGALMNELKQSPIQIISAQATAGQGQVRLQRTLVQSAAFEAGATGTVTLAPVLTTSTLNVPVSVSLSQRIARQLNLASAGSSSNAAYAPLPQFLTLTGTVGNPQHQVNRRALAGATVRAIGRSLFNPAPSNSTPAGNLLDQFLKFRK